MYTSFILKTRLECNGDRRDERVSWIWLKYISGSSPESNSCPHGYVVDSARLAPHSISAHVRDEYSGRSSGQCPVVMGMTSFHELLTAYANQTYLDGLQDRTSSIRDMRGLAHEPLLSLKLAMLTVLAVVDGAIGRLGVPRRRAAAAQRMNTTCAQKEIYHSDYFRQNLQIGQPMCRKSLLK